MDTEVIKVSSHSGVNAVAGAIAGMIREKKAADVEVIGAGALNQAVKAVIIARGFLAPEGLELWMQPSFHSVSINTDERTAIRLSLIAK